MKHSANRWNRAGPKVENRGRRSSRLREARRRSSGEAQVMLYKLARLLQLAGLVILPVAISGNVAERSDGEPFLSLKDSLSLSTIGVIVFILGWLLQQGSRPR
jgi:hypothetical protein